MKAHWLSGLLESLLLWWQSNLGGVALMLLMLVCLLAVTRRLAQHVQASTARRDEQILVQLHSMQAELVDCRREHRECETRGRRLEVAFAGLHGYLAALKGAESAPKLPTLEELFSGSEPDKNRSTAAGTRSQRD
jgi:hypothetical protein